jgi:hypothetical protein
VIGARRAVRHDVGQAGGLRAPRSGVHTGAVDCTSVRVRRPEPGSALARDRSQAARAALGGRGAMRMGPTTRSAELPERAVLVLDEPSGLKFASAAARASEGGEGMSGEATAWISTRHSPVPARPTRAPYFSPRAVFRRTAAVTSSANRRVFLCFARTRDIGTSSSPPPCPIPILLKRPPGQKQAESSWNSCRRGQGAA